MSQFAQLHKDRNFLRPIYTFFLQKVIWVLLHFTTISWAKKFYLIYVVMICKSLYTEQLYIALLTSLAESQRLKLCEKIHSTFQLHDKDDCCLIKLFSKKLFLPVIRVVFVIFQPAMVPRRKQLMILKSIYLESEERKAPLLPYSMFPLSLKCTVFWSLKLSSMLFQFCFLKPLQDEDISVLLSACYFQAYYFWWYAYFVALKRHKVKAAFIRLTLTFSFI